MRVSDVAVAGSVCADTPSTSCPRTAIGHSMKPLAQTSKVKNQNIAVYKICQTLRVRGTKAADVGYRLLFDIRRSCFETFIDHVLSY